MADITIKNYVIIAHEQGVTAYPINSTNLTFKTIKTLLKGYCEIITGVYKLSQILTVVSNFLFVNGLITSPFFCDASSNKPCISYRVKHHNILPSSCI